MPALKQDQVLVACPHCGHQQPEWREAFSTHCRKCGRHYRVQEALNPAPKPPDRTPPQQHITCFECGVEQDVPASAESTMCKRCGRYVDLHNYTINGAASKNYKTKGHFIVEPKGYVFNTETTAGDIIIKGRFHGKLVAERSLTIYTGSEIKGTVTATAANLIIPAENHFRWPAGLKLRSADIAGELVADVQAAGTVILRSTARCFGDFTAQSMIIEPGAVIVGTLRVSPKLSLYDLTRIKTN